MKWDREELPHFIFPGGQMASAGLLFLCVFARIGLVVRTFLSFRAMINSVY